MAHVKCRKQKLNVNILQEPEPVLPTVSGWHQCATSYIPVKALGSLPGAQGFGVKTSTTYVAGKPDMNNPQGLLRDFC